MLFLQPRDGRPRLTQKGMTMKNTPKKRKSRLVETEDGRLLIKSPMAYVYLLLPMAFL